jgi:hypothetical protein
MVPTSPDSLVLTGSTALLVSLVIQAVKNSSLVPWINRQTPKLNMAISMAAALATQLGIHWAYNATTDTVAIVGLHAALTHGLWQAVQQWVAQHLT